MRHLTWYGPWHSLLAHGLPKKLAQALRHWLPHQRWFLDKHAKHSSLEIVKAMPLPLEQSTVWWLLFQVKAAGACRQYQLPLVLLKEWSENTTEPIARLHGVDEGWIIDAWHWPPLASWALQLMAEQGTNPQISTWSSQPLSTTPQPRILKREQSNTAIVFGDKYFLKVLRIVSPGPQPEEEMCRLLAGRKFPNTIQVIAGLSAQVHSQPYCLALLYHYVDNQGNGWDWFQSGIKQHAGLPEPQRQAHQEMLMEVAHQLGQRTRQLHECLAQSTSDLAFSPQPYTPTDFKMLCARIQSLYETTVNKLRQSRLRDPEAVRLVRRLRALKPTVQEITHRSLPDTELKRHRIHGDFHLGQVLRTENDWLIIDFEGEPLRSLAERRAKDVGIRDITGMLRSFAYLKHATASSWNESEEHRQQFFRDLVGAFLRGYTHPERRSYDPAFACLFWLLELEKALYEINYELASRPDWVSIPLAGAVELLE